MGTFIDCTGWPCFRVCDTWVGEGQGWVTPPSYGPDQDRGTLDQPPAHPISAAVRSSRRRHPYRTDPHPAPGPV